MNLALSTSSERIREPKFNTVKRGYEPAQVLEYLSKIADWMEVLESQVKELGSQLEGPTRSGTKRWRSRPPRPTATNR